MDELQARLSGARDLPSLGGSSWLARNARPASLLGITAGALWNVVVLPLLGKPPVDVPPGVIEIFGIAFLGYVAGRTWEKVKGASR